MEFQRALELSLQSDTITSNNIIRIKEKDYTLSLGGACIMREWHRKGGERFKTTVWSFDPETKDLTGILLTGSRLNQRFGISSLVMDRLEDPTTHKKTWTIRPSEPAVFA